MFTKELAKKITIQLRNITPISIHLLDVNKNLLSKTIKEKKLQNLNEEIALYSFNELIGYFTVEKSISSELLSFIKSYIEISYDQQLLLNETFLPSQITGKFIELIEGNLLTQEDIKKIEKRFSLFFVPPYQVAIFKIESHTSIHKTYIQHYFEKLPVLLHFFTDNHFCIISFQSSTGYFKEQLTNLTNKLITNKISFQLGISSSVISYHLLNKAWHEALEAFYLSKNRETCYEDIILESLLKSSSSVQREDYLYKVLNHLPDKYEETIEKFCEYNLNIANCSKAMYIHRNSLIYRLRKIHEITGLNPMVAQELFLLTLALKIKKIDS